MSMAAAALLPNPTAAASQPPLWECDWHQPITFDAWLQKSIRQAVQQALAAVDNDKVQQLKQLVADYMRNAVQSVQAVRIKKADNGNTSLLHDPAHVWWISKFTHKKVHIDTANSSNSSVDAPPAALGARLCQLSTGAWMNACAGKPVVTMAHPISYQPDPVLWQAATILRRLVQNCVRQDIWRTTPNRIRDHLVPDLTAAEFATIRARIYETVVAKTGSRYALNHGHERGVADATLATAPAHYAGQHAAESYKKCPACGNQNQADFALDKRGGDVICKSCGTVVAESLAHEGSAYRKFEGEADRNHHGDAPNALYSNAHNLSTSLSAVAATVGAGKGGFGSLGRGGGNLETTLRNAHAYTELNLSSYGNTDRKTREGYRDKQKKEAFHCMQHTADALSLHEAVVQRAKELFASFRDDRELVQQFKGVLAACLCQAFEQLARGDGKTKDNDMLLKGVTGSMIDTTPITSARHARKNELHSTTLAGKGGVLLDKSVVTERENIKQQQDSTPPASSWDLEACRSWLLDASKRIAQQWVNARESAETADQKKKWPTGKLGELEGRLAEHSIALCEHLESELRTRAARKGTVVGSSSKNRVSTPRVRDMSKLGIQWQHGHERGSGGKGGVGGSGVKRNDTGRTAGQILILLTAKKLSSLLEDPLAGKSIHKELRAVVAQEQTLKRKKLLQDQSRKRMKQMQRKPWIQARAQADS